MLLVDPNPIPDQDDVLLSDDPEALLDSLLSDSTPPCNSIESPTEQDFQIAH